MTLVCDRWVPNLILNGRGTEGTAEIDVRSVNFVASYSWLKRPRSSSSQPTIVIPGLPPLQKQPRYPFRVEPDRGTEYGDPNVAEIPQSPMLPIFTSVKVMQPAFSFAEMDVITDKSVLRNLTRWVRLGKFRRDFDIIVEMIGDRALLISQPNADQNYSSGLYRKNPELAHTSFPQGMGQKLFGHHRIIQYKLGALQLLVRSPVDIYNAGEEDVEELLSSPAGNVFEESAFQKDNDGLDYVKFGKELKDQGIVEVIVRKMYARGLNVNGFTEWVTGSNEYTADSTEFRNVLNQAKTDLKKVELLLQQIRQFVLDNKVGSNSTGDNDILKFSFNKQTGIKIFSIGGPSNIPSSLRAN